MESQAKLFLNLSDDIELVPYDYSQNNYRHMLKKAYEKDLEQIIFTTSIYKKMITKIYEKGYYIVSINFMDPLDGHDFSDIKEIVNQINISENNETFIKLLLNEIDWFASKESIDIKFIKILDKNENKTIEIYNNGVVLGEQIQMEKVKDDVFTILKENI